MGGEGSTAVGGDLVQISFQVLLGVMLYFQVLLDFVYPDSTPVHPGSHVETSFFLIGSMVVLRLLQNFTERTFGHFCLPLSVYACDGGWGEEQVKSIGKFGLLPVGREDGRAYVIMDGYLSADDLVGGSVHTFLLYEDHDVLAAHVLDHRPIHGGCSVRIWRKHVAHRLRPLVSEQVVVPPLAPVQHSGREVVEELFLHPNLIANVIPQLFLRDQLVRISGGSFVFLLDSLGCPAEV